MNTKNYLHKVHALRFYTVSQIFLTNMKLCIHGMRVQEFVYHVTKTNIILLLNSNEKNTIRAVWKLSNFQMRLSRKFVFALRGRLWRFETFTIIIIACSTSRQSFELKHSSCWKIFMSIHHLAHLGEILLSWLAFFCQSTAY